MEGEVEEEALAPPRDSPAARAEMRAQANHLANQVLPSLSSFAAEVEAISASLQKARLNPAFVNQLPLGADELNKLSAQDIFNQLADFTEQLQHQMNDLVLKPLQEFKREIDNGLQQAKLFDEESEALDAAALRYLSLSRDSPVETRAYVSQELNDKAAGVALHFFDAQKSLRHACGSQGHVPQRALAELLVSQLTYHQSCARLLTDAMPQETPAALPNFICSSTL